MFEVIYKYTDAIKPTIRVYAVRTLEDNTIQFLIYNYEGWKWIDADMYEPVEL